MIDVQYIRDEEGYALLRNLLQKPGMREAAEELLMNEADRGYATTACEKPVKIPAKETPRLMTNKNSETNTDKGNETKTNKGGVK
jgi:hypothetical protein